MSIMSSNSVPIQEISDTVGHRSTHVTEIVYRHVIVPAIRGGATVMDEVFKEPDPANAGEPGGNAKPRSHLICHFISEQRSGNPGGAEGI
jgi:hypothetical protein